MKYYKHGMKAKWNPEECLSVTLDGMDQGKQNLPHLKRSTKVMSVLLCESKNREHFELILTFPIVQQPIRRDVKPQENRTNASHKTTLGLFHSKRSPSPEVFSLLVCLFSFFASEVKVSAIQKRRDSKLQMRSSKLLVLQTAKALKPDVRL